MTATSPRGSPRADSSIAASSSVWWTAFSSIASSAARSQVSSASSVTSTTSPSRQARGATSAQRMKTSSRNATSGIGRSMVTSRRARRGRAGAAARRSARSAAARRRRRSAPALGAEGRRSSSSRCPRAIVTGVRSSWETFWSSRSCCSSSDARSSASAWTVLSACTRRRACQTIARNIADISGTSNSSPQSWSPSNASVRIEVAPVAITTAAEDQARHGPATRPGSRRAASG